VYLDELVALIYDEYDVITTESTIYRELKRAKWSWKKVICKTRRILKITDRRHKRRPRNVTNTFAIDGRLVCVNGKWINLCFWMNRPVMNVQEIANW